MTTKPSRSDILERLDCILLHIAEGMGNYYARTFSHIPTPEVKIDGNGKRYIRVSTFKWVEARGKSYPDSVYFFVDTTNGNLLRAASYKAPDTKNPRGNIFDGDVLTKLTPYGVIYLGTKYALKDTIHGLCGWDAGTSL